MTLRPTRRLGTVLAATVLATTTIIATTTLTSASANTFSGASPRAVLAPSSSLPAAYQAFLARAGGSKFVNVHGVRMHFVETGERTRPTLLLLHGSPDNIYSWRNVIPALARSYHVIAPDLIGFGQSGKLAGPLSWSKEIRYLTGFINAEHLHHLTLVTTDVGGLFGFSYADAHPHNVDAIALWETVTAPIPSYELLGSYCAACVAFFQIPKNQTLAQKYIIDNPDFAAQVYGGSGLLHPLSADQLAGYSYFLSTPAQRSNIVDIGANMPIAGEPAGNYAIAAQFARYLRTSTIPKLVLYGTPGAILPGATAIGLGLPNATYVAAGAGYHYLVEDQPAALTQAILTWRAHLPETSQR